MVRVSGTCCRESWETESKFHDLLTTDQPLPKDLGKLVVFSGVREFPARVKCATLAWHTLRAALRGAGEAVSTE